MGEHGSLSARMGEAARTLQAHQEDPQGTFDLAVELSHANIDHCDGAALTFVRTGKVLETVATSSPLAACADRLQHEVSEGPCLGAVWEERIVQSPSLGYDRRWPTWGPRVVEETGAHSILCFQLFTHRNTVGALSLYSCTRDAFDESDREEGAAIAAHVAVAIATSQKIGNLSGGLDSRTIIGQATGLVMERFHLDAARAFGVLTRLSSENNVKVRDVTADIVADQEGRRGRTGRRPDPDGSPPWVP